MKLNIKALGGNSTEISLNAVDPSVREIRVAIANARQRPWHLLFPVIHLGKNIKVAIFLDSDPSETLSRIIDRNGASVDLPQEVDCYVTEHLGITNISEPSHYNPRGLGISGIAAIMKLESAEHRIRNLEYHFPSEDQQEFARGLVNEYGLITKNYTNRFAALNLEDSVIPDNFRDPITEEIMNSPIVCSDQYIYDQSTLSRLPVSQYSRLPMSPFTNQPITIIEHAIRLHAAMELFLKPREQALCHNRNRGGATIN